MVGHNDVFLQLAARLDDPTEIPSLPEILKLMVTEREAAILLSLPGTLEDIAKKSNTGRDEVMATLDKCYSNGLVLRFTEEGKDLQYAFPDLYVDNILSDHRNNNLGPRYRKLWRQWTREQRARRVFVFDPEPTPNCRILPVCQTVEDHNTIISTEDARAIVEASRCRVVQQCACRYRNEGCKYPVDDICIIFDSLAEQAVSRGYAKEASKEEVLNVLEQASQLGLVHVSTSAYFAEAPLGTEFICNCCTCCCELLEPYFASNRKLPIIINYYAQVDEEKCTGCLLCDGRCHFDALKFRDNIAFVDRENCVGCGLCTIVCDQGAISLKKIPGKKYQPAHVHRHVINPRK